MPLSDCIPVRLTGASDEALKALHKTTKVNKSALIRLAVAAGLPVIAAQFGPNAGTPKPAKSARRRSKPAA